MLKLLAALLAIALLLLKTFLKPKPKAARDVLPEESPTAKAVEEAEAEATTKFGPRP